MKRWFGKDEDGAIVVEAAISLPAFMFFIVTILFIVNLCIAQSRVQIALNETAKEISEYSYFFSMTGIAELQQLNYGKTEELRDNLDGVLGGVTTIYDGIGDIIGTGEAAFSSVANFDGDIEEAINTIDTAGSIIESDVNQVVGAADSTVETLENMFSDPRALLVNVTRLLANELTEVVKSRITALMTQGLIRKNLIDRDVSDKLEVDNYLKHLGITNGFAGIDFTNSYLFLNGSDDIVLIAEYDLHVIELLNVDINLHMVQSAPTKAWMAAEGSNNSGTVIVHGRETGTDPDNDSGDTNGIVVNVETESSSEAESEDKQDIEEDTKDGGEIATTAGNELESDSKKEISSNTLKHINNEHNPNKYAQQLKYKPKADALKELEYKTFFNQEWDSATIENAVKAAYKEALDNGITSGKYEFTYKGDIVIIALENGEVQTAYGDYDYEYDQLLNWIN